MNCPRWLPILALLILLPESRAQNPAQPPYVKMGTREETIQATLEAMKLPNLKGEWYLAGPFPNEDNQGLETPYGPEKSKAFDAKEAFVGKDEKKVVWESQKNFAIGKIVNLDRYPNASRNSVVYLRHEVVNPTPEPLLMPLYLGSDDGVQVFLNGKSILTDNAVRPNQPYSNECEMKLLPGKNELLVKVSNGAGEYTVFIQPGLPRSASAAVKKRLERDFGGLNLGSAGSGSITAESKHYRIDTLPLPEGCVLEVGGMGFRSDGKLFVCTRRGEVWLVQNPLEENTDRIKMTRFAVGMHESLGLVVEKDNQILVTQRPELTRVIDRDNDGKADEFDTLCNKWGVSGDYHEYAFGPARDKDGNMFLTLNVGFGFGAQGKAPWRGWCVKVSPDGSMEPWAVGLRSPNGINFSPDGDLFYCDNQGEWVASNKMHHVQKGDNFGHQASFPWIKDSPFKGIIPDQVESNLRYDGQAVKPGGKAAFPKFTPPAIWFPYGRMGQSATEPRWDTTAGKFGPFAGQCFVGDQTKSIVMRVDLQKVNGKFQGACFPFRAGFQCGVNRILFAPDGSLFVGETSRGWGSLGGKPYGLQRLTYTGVLPFEIHTMKLTKDGYAVTFTKPVKPEEAQKLESYTMKSFTYTYFSNYGCPEIDTQAEKVTAVKLSDDRKTATLTVPNLRIGRVYDLHIENVKAEDDGENLLHPDAYYTLNELMK